MNIQKTVVDLFCGCGGISSGFAMAKYKIVAGIDVEKNFIATFKHNFRKAKAITQNITEIPAADFASKIGIGPGELGVLVGGPPCQGFSKNVPRKHRYLEDPKNLLVKSFLEYTEYLQPQLILMENVAEMKNGFDGAYTNEIVRRLEAAGYTVSYAVLNAADYGVPQRRRRAFFMANRLGIKFKIPLPTHVRQDNGFQQLNQPKHVNVWDAIGDLPPLQHGEGSEQTLYNCDAFSDFQKTLRNPNGIVANHISRFLQPTQFERLNSLKPGQGLKDLPKHLQVKGGFSGAYGRLTKAMTAPTITRWVFHPGSGRWGHPVDIRVLSIREIARIQSFPDKFEFVGTYTEQAGQLGNAVPPLLVLAVIKDLERQLKTYNESNISINVSNDMRSFSEGRQKAIA